MCLRRAAHNAVIWFRIVVSFSKRSCARNRQGGWGLMVPALLSGFWSGLGVGSVAWVPVLTF
jgi:hypothetical protein